jgi:hypothetical protein
VSEKTFVNYDTALGLREGRAFGGSACHAGGTQRRSIRSRGYKYRLVSDLNFHKGGSFMPAPISKEDAPSMALSQEQDDQNPWTLEKVLLDELKRLRPGVNLNADTMTERVTLQVSTSAKATAPRWESCIWLESISSRACSSSPRSWPQRLNRLVSVDLGPALS